MRAAANEVRGGIAAIRYSAIRSWPDLLHAAHIGPKRIRNGDRAVGVLVVLHDGDQRAADRDAGPVQGVDEAVALPLLRPEAGLHPPRLEVAADRARRNFAERPLPRQPDLDVIGLLRAKPMSPVESVMTR